MKRFTLFVLFVVMSATLLTACDKATAPAAPATLISHTLQEYPFKITMDGENEEWYCKSIDPTPAGSTARYCDRASTPTQLEWNDIIVTGAVHVEQRTQ